MHRCAADLESWLDAQAMSDDKSASARGTPPPADATLSDLTLFSPRGEAVDLVGSASARSIKSCTSSLSSLVASPRHATRKRASVATVPEDDGDAAQPSSGLVIDVTNDDDAGLASQVEARSQASPVVLTTLVATLGDGDTGASATTAPTSAQHSGDGPSAARSSQALVAGPSWLNQPGTSVLTPPTTASSGNTGGRDPSQRPAPLVTATPPTRAVLGSANVLSPVLHAGLNAPPLLLSPVATTASAASAAAAPLQVPTASGRQLRRGGRSVSPISTTAPSTRRVPHSPLTLSGTTISPAHSSSGGSTSASTSAGDGLRLGQALPVLVHAKDGRREQASPLAPSPQSLRRSPSLRQGSFRLGPSRSFRNVLSPAAHGATTSLPRDLRQRPVGTSRPDGGSLLPPTGKPRQHMSMDMLSSSRMVGVGADGSQSGHLFRRRHPGPVSPGSANANTNASAHTATSPSHGGGGRGRGNPSAAHSPTQAGTVVFTRTGGQQHQHQHRGSGRLSSQRSLEEGSTPLSDVPDPGADTLKATTSWHSLGPPKGHSSGRRKHHTTGHHHARARRHQSSKRMGSPRTSKKRSKHRRHVRHVHHHVHHHVYVHSDSSPNASSDSIVSDLSSSVAAAVVADAKPGVAVLCASPFKTRPHMLTRRNLSQSGRRLLESMVDGDASPTAKLTGFTGGTTSPLHRSDYVPSPSLPPVGRA